MKNKHFFLTCVSVKGLKTPREGVHRSGIDCHREKGTANSPAFSQGIFGSDIQEFPENLDDLSTPGTGCCHLAGNYLPFRTVDWAAKKKGSSQRSAPVTGMKREKKIYERWWVSYSKKSPEKLIMRRVKETQLSEQTERDGRTGNTHPCFSSLDANLGMLSWGRYCAPIVGL